MQWQRRLMALLLMSGLFAEAEASPASATASWHLRVVTEQGDTLVDAAAPQGSRWCIQWQHSVEHFTVLDCYRNAGGIMQLERSHQPDFAAGLGRPAELASVTSRLSDRCVLA